MANRSPPAPLCRRRPPAGRVCRERCGNPTQNASVERRSLAVWLLALRLLLVTSCSSLRREFVKPVSFALPLSPEAPLTRYVRSEAAAHPGQSGFRALLDSKEALATRIALVDRAATSVDLQYYIFDNDPTGKLLALHLLRATDRRVRVRILLDDINLEDESALFDVLDASPLIEVRVFNPLRTRDASWL